MQLGNTPLINDIYVGVLGLPPSFPCIYWKRAMRSTGVANSGIYEVMDIGMNDSLLWIVGQKRKREMRLALDFPASDFVFCGTNKLAFA